MSHYMCASCCLFLKYVCQKMALVCWLCQLTLSLCGCTRDAQSGDIDISPTSFQSNLNCEFYLALMVLPLPFPLLHSEEGLSHPW